MGRASLAHAFTLVLASRHRNQLLSESLPSSPPNLDIERFVLRKAWVLQMEEDLPREAVDVDRECVSLLEELMFSRSRAAGDAGYYQWGLDAGDHQGGWSPYDYFIQTEEIYQGEALWLQVSTSYRPIK